MANRGKDRSSSAKRREKQQPSDGDAKAPGAAGAAASSAAAAAVATVPTPLRERAEPPAAEATPCQPVEAVKEKVEASMETLAQITPLLSDLVAASNYKKDMEELRNRLVDTEEELHKRARELWKLRAEYQSLSKEHQQDKAVITQQQQQLGEARDAEEDHLRRIKVLEGQLSESAARFAEAEAELKSLEASKADLQEKLDQALEDTKQQVHQQKQLTQRELEAKCEEKLQAMRVELANENLQQSLLNEGALHDMEAQLKEARLANEEIAAQLEHAQNKKSEEVLEAQDAVTAAQAVVQRLEEQLVTEKAQREDELAAMQAEVKVLEKDVLGARQETQDAKDEVSTLKEQLTAVQRGHEVELASLKAELSQSEEDRHAEVLEAQQSAQDVVQTLEDELASVKQGYETKLSSLQAEVQEVRAQKSTEILEAQQSAQDAQVGKQTLEDELSAVQQRYEAQLNALQAELQEARAQTKCEVMEAQQSAQDAQDVVNSLEDELASVKQSCEAQLQSLKAELKEAQAEKKSEIVEARQAAQEAQDLVQALEEELASVKQRYEREVCTMQAELDRKCAEKEHEDHEGLPGGVASSSKLISLVKDMIKTQEAEMAAVMKKREHTPGKQAEQASGIVAAECSQASGATPDEPVARCNLRPALDEAAAASNPAGDANSRLCRQAKMSRSSRCLEKSSPSSPTLLLAPMSAGRHSSLPNLPPFSELVGDETDPDVRIQQLTLSMEQLKADCELLEAENCSLKEVMAAFEGDLDQHAQSIGHINHKQKIRYTLQLKDEINRLLEELRKARQRIIQLEANQTNEHLLEALASLGMPFATSCRQAARNSQSHRGALNSARESRPRRRCTIGGPGAREPCHTPLEANTPTRAILTPPKSRVKQDLVAEPAELAEAKAVAAEAEKCCDLQRRALERLTCDFRHLRLLIERVVMVAGAESHMGAVTFPELLDRLRSVIAAARRDGWQGVAPSSSEPW
mmetsp:Transcript_19263/g.44977  ORF Transcript_19263/g.44977 Transcript_19263/m.44977 type:complete len:980 (-) Transcript_19263:235-3174(-)